MYCEAGGEARLGPIDGHRTIVFPIVYSMVVCSLCGHEVVVIYQEAPGQGEGGDRRLTMPFLVSSKQCTPSLPSWNILLS